MTLRQLLRMAADRKAMLQVMKKYTLYYEDFSAFWDTLGNLEREKGLQKQLKNSHIEIRVIRSKDGIDLPYAFFRRGKKEEPLFLRQPEAFLDYEIVQVGEVQLPEDLDLLCIILFSMICYEARDMMPHTYIYHLLTDREEDDDDDDTDEDNGDDIVDAGEEEESAAPSGVRTEDGFWIDGTTLVCYDGADGDVTVPEGITRIGPKAFLFREKITSVTLPHSLVSIGHHAFYGCVELTAVALPDAVEVVEACAFAGCLRLRSVTAKGVRQMGLGAFWDTLWQEEPEGLLILGSVLLGGKTAPGEALVIPEGVETVLAYSFYGVEFAALSCPASLREIGEYAFGWNRELRRVELRGERCTLQKKAFAYCDKLEEFCHEGVELYAAADAFCDVPCGESAAATAHIAPEEKEEYRRCEHPDDEDAPLEQTPGRSEVPDDPERHYAWLNDHAYADTKIIAVPRSRWVDAGRDWQTEPAIEAAWGSDAAKFALSRGWELHLVLDKAARKLLLEQDKRGEAEKCENVTKIIVDSNESLDEYSFIDKHIVRRFPNVRSFAVSRNMRKATEYYTKDGVLYGGLYGVVLEKFPWGRTGSFCVPEEVMKIETFAFFGCKLDRVTLPDGLQDIESRAFVECNRLRTIAIPANVSCLCDCGDSNPFVDCAALESVEVDPANEYCFSHDGVLYRGNGQLLCYPSGRAGAVVLPRACRVVCDEAFCGCHGLTAIAFPEETPLRIGWAAFENCTGLRTVLLPANVESLDEYAFCSCKNLQNVYMENPDTQLDHGCASNSIFAQDPNVTVHVSGGGEAEHRLLSMRVPLALYVAPGTQEIPAYAYRNEEGLRQVFLPGSVEKIGESAFDGCCELERLVVPGGVRQIDADAFLGCHRLTLEIFGNPYVQRWAEEHDVPFVCK